MDIESLAEANQQDPQHLYRHYDSEDNLLYVGVSLSAVHRLSQHKKSAHWFSDIRRVEIETFDSREAVLDAERTAIYSENPLHNLKRPTPKEVRRAQKEADRESNAEKSKTDLVRRLVQFNPMYTIPEAASALNLGVARVKTLVSENKIGWAQVGTRTTKKGVISVIRITGWQLIDFIEQLEDGRAGL